MTEVPNGGHARWEGDAAAYALDALDEAEVRAFEEHLAACSRCQSELAVMRRAVEELPAAPPPSANQAQERGRGRQAKQIARRLLNERHGERGIARV